MTVIDVEHIESCQQDAESINTRVIRDGTVKTVFLHQWLRQFCQNLVNLFSFHTPKDI